jgi:hypothetical protein
VASRALRSLVKWSQRYVRPVGWRPARSADSQACARAADELAAHGLKISHNAV